MKPLSYEPGPYEAGLIGFCIGLLLSLLLVDLFLISDPVIEQICHYSMYSK